MCVSSSVSDEYMSKTSAERYLNERSNKMHDTKNKTYVYFDNELIKVSWSRVVQSN